MSTIEANEEKCKSVILTQKVYIDQIESPTDDWSDFNKIFDALQKECINASTNVISFCNLYASYWLELGKDKADSFVKDTYNTDKRRNASYSICRNNSKLCYSGIMAGLSREILSRYFSGDNSYFKKIKRGEGNPPMTYTESLPIPMITEGAYVVRSESNNPRYFNFRFPLLSTEGKKEFSTEENPIKDGFVRFSTFAKNDYVYAVLDNIVCGNYKLCGSKLKRVETKKRIKKTPDGGKRQRYEYILLLSYKKPVSKKPATDEHKVMGVDLGIAIPAMCAVGFNEYYRKALGGNKIINENIKQEKVNRQLQRGITYNCRDGHGRKTKLDGYDGKGHKIKNRNDTYNHMLAKQVVEQAIKWECDTIHIEDLSKIKNGTNNKFLGHWTYFDLQQKIISKAAANGIEVKKIDPYRTSKTCSFCGHYEPGQRTSQSEFICRNKECKNFGKPINADFNAARNIAMSTKFK